jgi:hypothetical protein
MKGEYLHQLHASYTQGISSHFFNVAITTKSPVPCWHRTRGCHQDMDATVPTAVQHFTFMSAADEEKRNRLLHPKRNRLSGDAVNSALKRLCHSCTFPECNLSFSTQYRLQQHKEQCGHKLQKGRPRRN